MRQFFYYVLNKWWHRSQFISIVCVAWVWKFYTEVTFKNKWSIFSIRFWKSNESVQWPLLLNRMKLWPLFNTTCKKCCKKIILVNISEKKNQNYLRVRIKMRTSLSILTQVLVWKLLPKNTPYRGQLYDIEINVWRLIHNLKLVYYRMENTFHDWQTMRLIKFSRQKKK